MSAIRRTCPVCNHTYSGSVGVCPRDGTPLSRTETLLGLPPADGSPPVSPTPRLLETLPPGAELDQAAEESGESYVREPGTVLGSYRLLELLARGGMGQIYVAEHVLLHRQVALKFLRSPHTRDPLAVRRFFHEAQVVNQIRHPNIVEITDFVEADGTFYYVMELLAGESLGSYLGRERVAPLPLALHIVTQVCDALAAVHAANVIHRDLKPENVFLVPDEKDGPRVKLLDFGLVKLRAPDELPLDAPGTRRPLETNPGMIVGTPEYMAPEQARGVEIDTRADLYPVGVMLYELITGTRPFVCKTYGELLVQLLTVDPLPPSQRTRRTIPPRLEALVMRLLRKEPAERPATAGEVLVELREIAASPLGGDTIAAGSVDAAREEKIGPPTPPSSLGADEEKVGPPTPRSGLTTSPGVMPPAGVGRRARLAWLVAAITVLAAGGGAALLLLRHRPATTTPAAGTGSGPAAEQPIARLSQLWGDVFHRPRGSNTWSPATQGMALRYHDTIRSGRGARFRATFLAGGRIDADEETELLIEPPQAGGRTPQARVARGTIRVEAQPGVPLRFLGADGRPAEIVATGRDPVALRIRGTAGGALEVAALRGAVQVRSADGTTTSVGPDEAFEVRSGQPAVKIKLLPFPALSAPGVDARLREGLVTLRWVGVDGASRYRVQVSHFISFDENLADMVITGTELRFPELKADTYVWRVCSIDEHGREGEFGFARRFTTYPSETPAALPTGTAMIAPADRAVVEYVKGSRPVVFRWKQPKAATVLVIARARELLKHVEVKRAASAGRSEVEGLLAGVHYWGVYATDKQGELRPLFARPYRVVIVNRTNPNVRLPAIDWKQ